MILWESARWCRRGQMGSRSGDQVDRGNRAVIAIQEVVAQMGERLEAVEDDDTLW